MSLPTAKTKKERAAWRRFSEQIGAKLAVGSPMGRPQVSAEQRKKANQKHQSDYREKTGEAVERLSKEIDAAVEARVSYKDEFVKRRTDAARIAEEMLQEAENSTN